MDSHVKSRAAAYGPAAQAGAAGAGGAASASSSDAGAGTSTDYSASLGNIGASDVDGDDNGNGARSPADAFREAGTRLAELKEFASYYVGAKLDGVKVSFRNLGIYAALGIVGLIAVSAVITTSVVLLLTGLAFAIGAMFKQDRPWVGAIVVGVVVLGGLVGGIIFGMKKLTNTFRRQLVQKYENRQRDQRINFGEDVRGRREGA
jgi:hypothetical protein